MRKSRFPRGAYVRQLDTLYGDLQDWRDRYWQLAHMDWFEPRRVGYADRQNAIAECQSHLMDAIVVLDNLPRIS